MRTRQKRREEIERWTDRQIDRRIFRTDMQTFGLVVRQEGRKREKGEIAGMNEK